MVAISANLPKKCRYLCFCGWKEHHVYESFFSSFTRFKNSLIKKEKQYDWKEKMYADFLKYIESLFKKYPNGFIFNS